jgi:hypothetical protein
VEVEHANAVLAGIHLERAAFLAGRVRPVIVGDHMIVDPQHRAVVGAKTENVLAGLGGSELSREIDGKPFEALGSLR